MLRDLARIVVQYQQFAGVIGQVLPTPTRVFALLPIPSQDRLVVGLANGLIQIWDVTTGVLELELRGHKDVIMGLVMLPPGLYPEHDMFLASCSFDRTIRYGISLLGSLKVS